MKISFKNKPKLKRKFPFNILKVHLYIVFMFENFLDLRHENKLCESKKDENYKKKKKKICLGLFISFLLCFARCAN